MAEPRLLDTRPPMPFSLAPAALFALLARIYGFISATDRGPGRVDWFFLRASMTHSGSASRGPGVGDVTSNQGVRGTHRSRDGQQRGGRGAHGGLGGPVELLRGADAEGRGSADLRRGADAEDR